MKKHLILKVLLALLPTIIFVINYIWMTASESAGMAFLLIWILIIWSASQFTEKNHILERLFRLTEIAFFLLPISSIIFVFVFGAQSIASTSNEFEQAGAAIGTAIGGTFVIGLAFVFGLLGGIIFHLVTSQYEKKAEASKVKQAEVFANKYGTVLTLTGVILIAIVLGAMAAGTDTPSQSSQAKPESKTTTKQIEQPIQSKLLSKKFVEADFMKGTYSDTVTFSFEIRNTLSKDIRAFTGFYSFSDLFDREILDMSVTYEDALPAGETTTWDLEFVDYNQFFDDHQRLASIAPEDLQVQLVVEEVIFADGTRQQY